MSLKRVVLMAAVVFLVLPAAALADGITFGFDGNPLSGNTSAGHFVVTRPFVLGTSGSTTGTIRLSYLTRFSGPTPQGPPGAPTLGQAPDVNLPGTPANTFDFGTVSFTTGLATLVNGSNNATFGPGGSITITSNAGLTSATSGAIGNPVTLFSGSFSGPTTFVRLTQPSTGCAATKSNECYRLTGTVEGTLAAAILSYFNLGSSPNARGIMITLDVGFNGTTGSQGQIEGGLLSVVVPEPGTLALFGTGLVCVAGFIRRRFKV
jgi:hypothetical protein